MEIFSRFLGGLALFSARHPKKILIFALFLALGGIYLASGLVLETKIAALLPKEAPQLQEPQEMLKRMGSEDFMIVLVEAPPGFPIRYYSRFVRAFKKKLNRLPQVKKTGLGTSRVTQKDLGGYLGKHGLFLLEPEELNQFNQLLAPERIRALLEKYKTMEIIYAGPKFDPLEIFPFFEGIFIPFKDVTFEKYGRFLEFKNQEAAFFFIGIQATAGNFKKTKEFLKKAAQVQKVAWKNTGKRRVKLPGSEGRKLIPPPKVTWIGLPVILLENHEILSRTLFWNLLAALFSIALLFYVFFRRFRTLFLAYLPLLFGLIWSLALARLTVGSLNILTVGIGGILIGLGVDFPAYLLNRFFQYRETGKDPFESLRLTWAVTGRSVFFGALTTSAAFLLMMAASFRAFQELGMIAGFGILLTLLAVLIMLPALIILLDSKGVGKEIRRYPRPLINLPLLHPKATLVVCLTLFLGSGFFLTEFRLKPMDQELHRTLEETNSPSVQAFQRFSSMLQATLIPIPLVIQGKDFQNTLEQNERLADFLEKYKSDGLISAYESLSSLLPSGVRQKEARAKLKTLTNLNGDNFYQSYKESLSAKKFEKSKFHRGYQDFLFKILSDSQPVNSDTLKEQGLGTILNNYLKKSGENYLLKTYVYLPPDVKFFTARKRFFDSLDQELALQGISLSHSLETKIYTEIKKTITEELEWLGAGVLAVVFLLVWIYFGSIKFTLLSLFPMALGLVAALGSYILLVGPFSPANFLWFPIYLGLAVDDVIHLGTHFHKSNGSLDGALQKTGGAIVFTSLATILGFGSLALVEYPIVQQAGLFICLAMFWELIASLAFLPALWVLIYKRSS